MNYLIFKSIIETTIANFKCQKCGSSIVEKSINIVWAAGNSLNLEIFCPQCNTQWIVKAEIWMVSNLSNITNPDFLKQLKTQFSRIQDNAPKNENAETIKDEDILNIRENLKKSKSVEDLFN